MTRPAGLMPEGLVLCCECAQPLTPEEAHYFENRCTQCEVEAHERIQAWRAGAEDPELEARLFGPPATLH